MALKIDSVKVRMYCLGTGDCFILKFFAGKTEKFIMMIDCGSCQGKPPDFKPYLEDLADYVKDGIDLLVITHEHNDHVNGFSKCPEIFEKLKIKKAWMAWTENPEDPDGKADDLIHKRKKMRMALQSAMTALASREESMDQSLNGDYHQVSAMKGRQAFMKGLETLAEINLPVDGGDGEGLAGMKAIKKLLKEKKVKVRYMKPGETESFVNLPGLKFYILGPPYESEAVYKHEKEGTDVYKRRLSLSPGVLAANALVHVDQSDDIRDKDLPFAEEYIANEKNPSVRSSIAQSKELFPTFSFKVTSNYKNPLYSWRRIDSDWLNCAGSLAIRLNSHINNTSLAFAIEAEGSGKVMLLPGDAEFGSWESWHAIKKWKGKGANGKHLVEDLLNRTVFYKVSHHLSFNGTPTKLGIDMMESELAAMVTLDRRRISSKWKGTMPNKKLVQDLMRRSKGKLFIMDEYEIRNAPSKENDFDEIKGYEVGYDPVDEKKVLWKEYRVEV